jgi:hypothetical protein
MPEDQIHKNALLRTLRQLLSHIPHRPWCALVLLRSRICTCDVGDRTAMAYAVVANLLLDLRKGQR